jgi:hypothetical protein
MIFVAFKTAESQYVVPGVFFQSLINSYLVAAIGSDSASPVWEGAYRNESVIGF